MKKKHKELQETAIKWLHKTGCDMFATEVPFRNDIVDAIGIKTKRNTKNDIIDDLYFIEAKASRSDLICNKQRRSYAYSINTPCCDFYYFIIADGVNIETFLYPSWGVINEKGLVIRKAKRMTKNDPNSSWQKDIVRAIGHALVYRVYGKLYLN